MKLFHKHLWIPAIRGTAYFEKQPGQLDSRRYYDGEMQECEWCDAMQFVPANNELRTVRIEKE